MATTDLNMVLSQLLAGDDTTWHTFLYDVQMARTLAAKLDAESASRLLAAGTALNATAWTTSALSRRLCEVTGDLSPILL